VSTAQFLGALAPALVALVGAAAAYLKARTAHTRIDQHTSPHPGVHGGSGTMTITTPITASAIQSSVPRIVVSTGSPDQPETP